MYKTNEGEGLLFFQEAERRYNEARKAAEEARASLNLIRITQAGREERDALEALEAARKTLKNSPAKKGKIRR